jgi:hypothetical protein
MYLFSQIFSLSFMVVLFDRSFLEIKFETITKQETNIMPSSIIFAWLPIPEELLTKGLVIE